MKNWILGACLLPLLVNAQKVSEQTIKSDIKKVKLFLTAGEMTHEMEVKLVKGRNKLIFSGISAFANPQSIQYAGNGMYRLVSVTTEIDFLAAELFNPRIKVLKDSLENLKERHQANIDLSGAYNAELAVMNTNRDLGGKNQNFTVAQLKEAGEYYRTRTLEINKVLSKINKEQRNFDEKISETRYQLSELNYNENQRSNQVIILLDCDQAMTSSATLKYIVSDCGWAATYDLSATDLNLPINLKYKAQVYNNTGNEWKDVQLSLSTGDPNLSAASPNLNPFYISTSEVYGGLKSKGYVSPQSVQQDYRSNTLNEINMANQRVYDNYVLDKSGEQEKDGDVFFSSGRRDQTKTVQTVQMKQIEISELTAEFTINNLFSCPSDAKPYLVDIKEITLPATFTHVSIPKLDQGAFLLANIVGWQDLDLIPGPTNVYFGGNYVGVSEIDVRNVSDTLALSFGRDSKIQVTRKLKSELSTKKVAGSSKKDTYFYDIQVRNNRAVPVTIDVFDQIPLSRNSEITVSVETIGTGKKDDTTGEVKYTVTIQPGQVANLEIGYTVKYPKNLVITKTQFRTISCPSF